jgi:glutamine amidotransferase
MITLIDYGAGNMVSVSNVLKELNAGFVITNNKDEIAAAEKIILPGVGEASSAMDRLTKLGLVQILSTSAKPFLGICLGMQLLCRQTEEGNADCLGIIPVDVKKFDSNKLKVPHMGWNQLSSIKDSEIFDSINENDHFYFAHSYFVPQNEFTTSTTNYGINFSASVRYRNFFGVQFHPEKSAEKGVSIIKNFLALC